MRLNSYISFSIFHSVDFLISAEAASRKVNETAQIHGGYRDTREYAVNRLFRDAKLYEIGAGTSEVRRLLIADELLKR